MTLEHTFLDIFASHVLAIYLLLLVRGPDEYLSRLDMSGKGKEVLHLKGNVLRLEATASLHQLGNHLGRLVSTHGPLKDLW